MSGKTWVYSDPHFAHANICKFKDNKGKPVRPWDDVNEMNEALVSYYNELVSDGDRVYILGDVAFSAKNMEQFVSQLKGRKCLIPGNHDPEKMRKYFHLFDDVRGYVQRSGFIMSHIPLHPSHLSRWKLNIHGHTHQNKVMKKILGLFPVEDKRYYSARADRDWET